MTLARVGIWNSQAVSVLDQGYINHVVFVLDRSGSMGDLQNEVVKVADGQISHLAARSKELDQETRATVYTFGSDVDCVYYDKDVLRLPSLRNKYRIKGNTALLDATYQAINELKQTATLYGDHAFLIFVLTDGQENASHRQTAIGLRDTIARLPDNWTLGVLVPDAGGMMEAKKFGFAPNNISVWSTTVQGITEVGESIKRATENFMVNRAKGVRGSKDLFNLDINNLNPAVAIGVLNKLSPQNYQVYPVNTTYGVDPLYIAEYIKRVSARAYKIGSAYYELTKKEEVQAQKDIAIMARAGGEVYVGTQARTLLGLPDYSVKVAPAMHPDYKIFIQSTSVNRKLVPGTDILVIGK